MLIRGWLPSTTVAAGTFLEPAVDTGYGYQATTGGQTGTSEPSWPLGAGATVVDGTVTWTAVTANVIQWKAEYLFKSGAVEPVWPVVDGGTVDDGDIRWTARLPIVTDAKCPHSRLAIAQSQKVYSPQLDVLRYSATNVPQDWSAEDDAGFLPTGIHAPTSQEVSALGEYRGRLAVFTPSSLQIWTTDPDPLEQALFDNIDGIGTTYHQAIASVSGDLFFLTPMGVRTLSIAAGANNLQAGDVGTGVDELVQAKLDGPDSPFAFYYPGAGQYWLVFGDEVFVYSQSRLGKIGAWSRYTFPWTILGATTLEGELYIRAANTLYRVDETAIMDNQTSPIDGSPIPSYVWWPYMDLGSPGRTKFLHTLDLVATSDAATISEIKIGTNQNDTDLVTGYTSLGSPAIDTLPEKPIYAGVAGASFSVYINFGSVVNWEFYALSLTFEDGSIMGQP